ISCCNLNETELYRKGSGGQNRLMSNSVVTWPRPPRSPRPYLWPRLPRCTAKRCLNRRLVLQQLDVAIVIWFHRRHSAGNQNTELPEEAVPYCHDWVRAANRPGPFLRGGH